MKHSLFPPTTIESVCASINLSVRIIFPVTFPPEALVGRRFVEDDGVGQLGEEVLELEEGNSTPVVVGNDGVSREA